MDQKLKTAEEIDAIIAQMSDEQKMHLRHTIDVIIDCYARETAHGLVLVSDDVSDMVTLIAINATDTQSAELLDGADTVLNFRTYADAPPKEMMN